MSGTKYSDLKSCHCQTKCRMVQNPGYILDKSGMSLRKVECRYILRFGKRSRMENGADIA